MAAGNGHLTVAETIKAKLKDPAAFKRLVDGTNEQRNTPLHWAVINNQLSFAKFLIENGCDTGIKNSDAQIALDMAIGNDAEELVVSSGGDIGQSDQAG